MEDNEKSECCTNTPAPQGCCEPDEQETCCGGGCGCR